jgi:hypothetical protein
MSQCQNLPPVEGDNNPCACCPPIPTQAPLDKVVAVGFGSAQVTCDGEFVADGENGVLVRDGVTERFEPWSLTFGDVEEMAVLRPGDWRIELHGPLHGETYQRQGPGQWVCVERNEGFA